VRTVAVIVAIVVVWAVGLLAFASRVDQSTPPRDPPVSDAVVALTGASNARIVSAMQLLEDGKGKRLLISGVNPEVTRADLRGVAKANQRLFDCCVDLGFQAMDTVGNAKETAAWASTNDIHSLILVTSDFHMPRAMLELRAALPDMKITAYPIRTEELDAKHWWRSRDGIRRMTLEYCKFLLIYARESIAHLGGKPHPKPAASEP
jgi:uncharacterized SAM-binding protein YcdF (DUF218 family)